MLLHCLKFAAILSVPVQAIWYRDQCFGKEQSACDRAEGCKYYGRRAYNGKGGCVTVGGPNDPDANSNLRGDQLQRQRKQRERKQRERKQRERELRRRER